MRTFEIGKQDAGIRLSRFVERAAPSLPQSALYKAIRTKHIKRNGRRCTAADRLEEGDVLELWLPEESFVQKERRPDFLRAGRELSVLFEDGDVAVLFKPRGLNAHPVRGDYSDNLVARFLRYLYEKGEYQPGDGVFAPALCNRLDRNTEGLVIAAKNRAAAEAVGSLIRAGKIRKTYCAVCTAPGPAAGIYDAHLRKDERQNRCFVTDLPQPDSKPIRTEFHPLAEKGELCLLEVVLHTGRPHQIRAHLAFLGFPILGDPKYGNAKLNRRFAKSQQLLTAFALQFDADTGGLLPQLAGLSVSLPALPYRELFEKGAANGEKQKKPAGDERPRRASHQGAAKGAPRNRGKKPQKQGGKS